MTNPENDISALAVAGALAGNYARDARAFLPLLATVLEASMPDETEIERKGGFFQKEKPVRKVRVAVESYIYEVEDPGNGRLAALRIQIVRNIVLKREPMHLDQWLHALAAEIAERAKTSERAYFALKNMVDYI